MDYHEYLIRPLSLHYVDQLAQQIFMYPADLDIVYQLIFDQDVKVAWRAAWTCQKISNKYPEWFTDIQFQQLSTLAVSISHGGLLRGTLSILNNLPIPGSVSVEFINACFDWMVSPKSPISVQSISMKMLYRISIVEPDFKQELIAILENIDPGDYSAGFNSTRKKVLADLIQESTPKGVFMYAKTRRR